MRGLWKATGFAIVLLIASLTLGSPVTRAGSLGSTLTGIWGELRDLELDVARNRLYASISIPLNNEGVVIVDLDTHEQVGRIHVNPESSGLALSPSGNILAVGGYGGVGFIDPGTLAVIDNIPLKIDPFTLAVVWAVAFAGEDRVVVTLESETVTCCVPVIAANLTTMQEESRIDETPYGIMPGSSVRVDSSRNRLYVIEPGSIWLYDLQTLPPAKISHVLDVNFTTSVALSSDGLRFYFSSGKVYDALTLSYIEDIGYTGDLFLDEAGGRIYFASGHFLDVVSLGDYSRVVRYAFEGTMSSPGELIGSVAVDTTHGIAYVTTGTDYAYRNLHAVPLADAIVDPYPPDGALITHDVNSIWALLSGDIDPSDAHILFDGLEVNSSYDVDTSAFGHHGSDIPDGAHTARITATDGGGQDLQLEWNFTIDTSPPEIIVDPYEMLQRAPTVIITGRIIDLTDVTAWAGLENLTLDPVTGAFSITLNLVEGANYLGITAMDNNSFSSQTSIWLLYLPSTKRYVDQEAQFSIEYPGNWTARPDVTIQGTKVDVIIEAQSSGIPLTPNLNIIRTGPQASYSQEYLRQQAQEAIDELSWLPGFSLTDSITNVSIEGLAAVTYGYFRDSGGIPIYQRQYLIANAEEKESWVLTFTCYSGQATEYDAYFRWMASTFRVEHSSSGPPILIIVVVVAVVIAVAAFLIIRRRVKRVAVPPPTMQSAEAGNPTESVARQASAYPPEKSPPGSPPG